MSHKALSIWVCFRSICRGAGGQNRKQATHLLLKSFVVLALTSLPPAFCQQAQDVAKGRPSFIPFTGTDVDAVNDLSGNLSMKIPLYSLPQRGHLALSFSIDYNPMGFALQQTCAQGVGTAPGSPPAHYNCSNAIDWRYAIDQDINSEIAPTTNVDQQLSVAGISSATGTINSDSSNFYGGQYFVIDPIGTQHPLGHASDGYRALDGSGFLLHAANPDPWPASLPKSLQYVPGTIVDTSGTQYQHPSGSRAC